MDTSSAQKSIQSVLTGNASPSSLKGDITDLLLTALNAPVKQTSRNPRRTQNNPESDQNKAPVLDNTLEKKMSDEADGDVQDELLRLLLDEQNLADAETAMGKGGTSSKGVPAARTPQENPANNKTVTDRTVPGMPAVDSRSMQAEQRPLSFDPVPPKASTDPANRNSTPEPPAPEVPKTIYSPIDLSKGILGVDPRVARYIEDIGLKRKAMDKKAADKIEAEKKEAAAKAAEAKKNEPPMTNDGFPKIPIIGLDGEFNAERFMHADGVTLGTTDSDLRQAALDDLRVAASDMADAVGLSGDSAFQLDNLSITADALMNNINKFMRALNAAMYTIGNVKNEDPGKASIELSSIRNSLSIALKEMKQGATYMIGQAQAFAVSIRKNTDAPEVVRPFEKILSVASTVLGFVGGMNGAAGLLQTATNFRRHFSKGASGGLSNYRDLTQRAEKGDVDAKRARDDIRADVLMSVTNPENAGASVIDSTLMAMAGLPQTSGGKIPDLDDGIKFDNTSALDFIAFTAATTGSALIWLEDIGLGDMADGLARTTEGLGKVGVKMAQEVRSGQIMVEMMEFGTVRRSKDPVSTRDHEWEGTITNYEWTDVGGEFGKELKDMGWEWVDEDEYDPDDPRIAGDDHLGVEEDINSDEVRFVNNGGSGFTVTKGDDEGGYRGVTNNFGGWYETRGEIMETVERNYAHVEKNPQKWAEEIFGDTP